MTTDPVIDLHASLERDRQPCADCGYRDLPSIYERFPEPRSVQDIHAAIKAHVEALDRNRNRCENAYHWGWTLAGMQQWVAELGSQPPRHTVAVKVCDTCDVLLGTDDWPWNGETSVLTHGRCESCFAKGEA